MSGGWTTLRRLVGHDLFAGPALSSEAGSLFVRHLDGGSSNLAEAELAALTGAVYDVSRYGIRFVASPRHADVLLLTGPLTLTMLEPAVRAWEVMPEHRCIVTVGDHADFSGRQDEPHPRAAEITRLLRDSYATAELPEEMRSAIVAHAPGDPPSPQQIIEVLLEAMRRCGR